MVLFCLSTSMPQSSEWIEPPARIKCFWNLADKWIDECRKNCTSGVTLKLSTSFFRRKRFDVCGADQEEDKTSEWDHRYLITTALQKTRRIPAWKSSAAVNTADLAKTAAGVCWRGFRQKEEKDVWLNVQKRCKWRTSIVMRQILKKGTDFLNVSPKINSMKIEISFRLIQFQFKCVRADSDQT